MADAKLTCTKLIRKDGGRDAQGRPIIYHERCGADASEVTVGGLLTKAKAVLCARHRQDAERESFVSKNGFTHGRVAKEAKKNGYQQERLTRTGISE